MAETDGEREAAGAADEAAYADLRDRFWQAAAVEGTSLEEFVAAELALAPSGAGRKRVRARLRRLVEEVADVRLHHIALREEEEGGVWAELAEERRREVEAERDRLRERLDTDAAP
ncbi:MAG: hypothetical protein K6V73_10280 [Firmicutes bacterium]|nr:hypothetical protein [Bacillota bacterium]